MYLQINLAKSKNFTVLSNTKKTVKAEDYANNNYYY